MEKKTVGKDRNPKRSNRSVLESIEERLAEISQWAHWVRCHVRWFAAQMEKRLRAHDDQAWEDAEYDLLLSRLNSSSAKLGIAIEEERRNGTIHAAADVANFAMMIADNAKREM